MKEIAKEDLCRCCGNFEKTVGEMCAHCDRELNQSCEQSPGQAKVQHEDIPVTIENIKPYEVQQQGAQLITKTVRTPTDNTWQSLYVVKFKLRGVVYEANAIKEKWPPRASEGSSEDAS
jgi:hypothetical protein